MCGCELGNQSIYAYTQASTEALASSLVMKAMFQCNILNFHPQIIVFDRWDWWDTRAKHYDQRMIIVTDWARKTETESAHRFLARKCWRESVCPATASLVDQVSYWRNRIIFSIFFSFTLHVLQQPPTRLVELFRMHMFLSIPESKMQQPCSCLIFSQASVLSKLKT